MGIVDYIKETRSELRHVSWPTRKQAINYTALVIGVSLFIAILLGAFDYTFDIILRDFILDIKEAPTSNIPVDHNNIGNIEQLPDGGTIETIPIEDANTESNN